LVFHDFWNYGPKDPQHLPQMLNFMKNTGLGGGALMVLAFGCGAWSLDALLPKRRTGSVEVGRTNSAEVERLINLDD